MYKPGPASPPSNPLPGSGAASDVSIGGLDAQSFTTTTDGVVTTLAYAVVKDRLVVFFARAPESLADGLQDVFDRARDSVGAMIEQIDQTLRSADLKKVRALKSTQRAQLAAGFQHVADNLRVEVTKASVMQVTTAEEETTKTK